MNELTALALCVLCVHFAGGLLAFHAVMSSRTPQGAIAWTLFLITFPYAGIPLYAMFGPRKFESYVHRLEEAYRIHRANIQRRLDFAASNRVHVSSELESTQRLFENLAGYPVTGPNEVRLLVDGQQFFDTLFETIERARDTIFIQFYIVHADEVGNELKSRLVKKSIDGVCVRFLYDQIGCLHLPDSYLDDLRRAGVIVAGFRTQGSINRFRLNFRNHRKIVVVDGSEALVGGHNIGDEYLGRNAHIGRWRDTHLYISGPAVPGIMTAFEKDWYWATDELIQSSVEAVSKDQGVPVLPIATGPDGIVEGCALFFSHAIRSAQRRIWITSPYFVPDESAFVAIQEAALRGIDIRILLPNKPDHPMVHLAGNSYIPAILEVGARVYRYDDGFLHQKVLLVDDSWASVGTANLDNRSFRLNFEISIAVFDGGFVSDVSQMLENDFKASHEISLLDVQKRTFLNKFAERACRVFSPIL